MAKSNEKSTTFFTRLADRTNPNRLTVGVLAVADQNENKVEVIPRAPTKAEQIIGYIKLGAIAILTVSGSLLGLHTAGTITLPPAILGVVATLGTLGAALGIGSGGLKPKPADPDALK